MNYIFWVAAFLVAMFLLNRFRNAGAGKYWHNISGDDFAAKMKDPGTVVLDVRTNGEYKGGHIPKALQIDISSNGFTDKIEQLDKSKTYLVYCRSGSRSGTACRVMASKGFTNLFNLSGGIGAWNGKVEK
jgi:rhodanese-related sulfurtransferase